MSAPAKTVLIVAAEFPPVKTIGRIRSTKFAEQLPDFGWHPIVLSLEPRPHDPGFQPALENEIPDGLEVIRTPWPDTEAELIGAAKRMLGKGRSAEPGGSADVARAASAPEPTAKGRSLFDVPLGLVKWSFRNLVYVPDNYRSWAKSALAAARRLCRERRVDVVFTTLPPFSAATVGWHLRKEFGIPWVADYRDLWYGDVLREWVPPLRQRVELALERHYMRRADAIVGVSEQKTEFLRQLLRNDAAIYETLTNGFDPEIFAAYRGRERIRDGRIRFTYTGRLFKNRRGYAFAEALGQLAAEDPAIKSRVLVRILGGVSPEIQARYDEILARYEIAELYDFAGDVPHPEAMHAQVTTDYLLLIVDTGATSAGVIPGKLFEYVAAERPIFALTDPGATQTIIERAGIGTVVPAEGVEACKAALRDVLAAPVPDELTPDEAYLAQFNRRDITRRLGLLLDRLHSANH